MVSPSAAAKGIEAGSTEFGDRQTLEANLVDAVGGGGAPGVSATQGGPGVTVPEEPLGALIGGEVRGSQDGSITDGLSVGAGTGVAGAPDQMLGDRATRLRQLALQGSNPFVRAAARQELRRMTKEPI